MIRGDINGVYFTKSVYDYIYTDASWDKLYKTKKFNNNYSNT